MNDGTPQAEPKPSFYLYKGEAGKWYRTSQAITDEINKHIYYGRDFDTQGHSFIPQWPEPDFKSETKSAWYLHRDGMLRMRWTLTIKDHIRTHSRCTPLGDGSCLQQCPLKVGWEPKHKMWIIIEPLNKATPEQMRKFNNPYQIKGGREEGKCPTLSSTNQTNAGSKSSSSKSPTKPDSLFQES